MTLFDLVIPEQLRSPVFLNVPHAGTWMPEELAAEFRPGLLPPDDTDWFVDRLYDFAKEMGIGMMVARCSRWIIDLNRNPGGQPLYSDGRVITALCPATDFNGLPLYADQRAVVSEEATLYRRETFFDPYHEALQAQLDRVYNTFGQVLLWDCHSIRRRVPAISREPFPDMILGTVDDTSADPGIISAVMERLEDSPYTVVKNHPFRGGYITRQYGNPAHRRHAIQLEMCKDVYMDNDETQWHDYRAAAIRETLMEAIGSATETMKQL